MEQTLSNNILPFRHISNATDESIEYIRKRKDKEIVPLKTRWKKLNKSLGGGIEPNKVIAISGISGSGKSSFVNTIETDLITLNPQQDIVVLSFSLEMMDTHQITRKISSSIRETTADIYSSEISLSEIKFNKIKQVANEIKKYPIYYINVLPDINQISETILYFQNTIAKNKWLVIVFDHTLLTKNNGNERLTISALQNVFIDCKKIGKTSIIEITQMNRNIESPERILNNLAHYPMRSDLSSSDSVFQGCDIVMVIHRPETLNIFYYGPKRLPVQNKVFIHILKNREGELSILEFENDLKYNNLIESSRDN